MTIIEKIRKIVEYRFYMLNGKKSFDKIIRDKTLEHRTLHGFINEIKSLGENWSVITYDDSSVIIIEFTFGKIKFVKGVDSIYFQ